MEFDRKELVNILKYAEKFVLKGGTMPLLEYVMFSNGYISAYNSIVGFIAKYDTQELNCLINFEKLFVFLKGGKKDIVTIERSDNTINLSCGRSKSTLVIGSIEDFPDFSDIYNKIKIDETGKKELYNGLKLCNIFAAKKGFRQDITGMNVIGNKIYATDGIRVAEYYFESQSLSEVGIIIPSELINACKFEDIDNYIVDDDKIIFRKDDKVAFSNLIMEKFPPVSQFFPTVKKFIILPCEELAKGLGKVGDFSGDVFDKAKCILDLNEVITIKYENSVAKISEFIDLGGKIPKGKYSLNPFHFSIMLKNCTMFKFLDKPQSMLFGVSEDHKFRCIMTIDEVE